MVIPCQECGEEPCDALDGLGAKCRKKNEDFDIEEVIAALDGVVGGTDTDER